MRLVILLFISFILISCTMDYPNDVEKALNAMSPKNRQKFEKVLDHFKFEEQKLSAAYQLIGNINDFEFYAGKPIEKYETLFDVLSRKPKNFRYKIPWYSTEVSDIIDSLETELGSFDRSMLKIVRDVDAMDTNYMIHYINQAFEAWENPWSRNVTFEDFCNYILPYRNNKAQLEDWRSMILEKYNWVYDSISGDSDILEVAKLLNKDTQLAFSNGLSRYSVPISTTNILRAGFGNCPDMSNYKAMVMRAFGIPVSIDHIPQWGNDHQAHTWNSIQDKNGNWVDFGETAIDSNTMVAYKYRLSKVYRKTLHKNKRWETLQKITQNQLPSFFKDSRNIDVTRQYVSTTDVKLRLDGIPKEQKVIYLCVFNNKGFTAMDFALIDSTSNNVSFKDLGRQVLYFPMYFSKNTFVHAKEPFIITEKGTITYVKPKKDVQDLVLTRKYHLHPRKINWLKSLLGGKFQGANTSDFTDSITIASITKMPSQHNEYMEVKTNRKFKFYRFLFNKNELNIPYDGDGAGIAEIEFFDKNNLPLKGNPIGTPGRDNNMYTPDLAFDGNPLTFFEDARNEAEIKWVGLELQNAKNVSRIRFRARNDLNNIEIGDEYELFYLKDKEFVSLGKQVAEDTILIYKNVHKNSVYLLKNLSQGSEERVFSYSNNKQVWW